MLDIFDKIKLELGENFKTGDDTVLANIIKYIMRILPPLYTQLVFV